MDERSAQERTEEPTARRLSKAREEGQVARSVELPAAAIVIGSFLLLMMSGGWLAERIADAFAAGFVFDRKSLTQSALLPGMFASQLTEAFLVVAPLIGITLVLAVVASGFTGGYLFAVKALAPKANKINPIEGFKRIFGPRAAVELGKAVLKFTLVSVVLVWSIASDLDELMRLGSMALEPGLAGAGRMIAKAALWVALSLAVIAAIDVPYQRHAFVKRMRMTKQEVKDELKDVEGRPEVKAELRRRQREMAGARMMAKVRNADVVVTNPEHFAVALEYDPGSDRPPIVVARGADFVAHRIREEAEIHGVQLFEAPPLARALYFTTRLDQPIPEALYHAVAQVIAYVYSLEGALPGGSGVERPTPEVPPGMRFDVNGRPT